MAFRNRHALTRTLYKLAVGRVGDCLPCFAQQFTYKLKPQNKFTMTIYSFDIYILEQIKQIQQIKGSLRFSSLAISQSHALEDVRLNTKCFMCMQIFCMAFRNRHALTRTLYKLAVGTTWYKLPMCCYPLVQFLKVLVP